jgi:hypothetical protein
MGVAVQATASGHPCHVLPDNVEIPHNPAEYAYHMAHKRIVIAIFVLVIGCLAILMLVPAFRQQATRPDQLFGYIRSMRHDGQLILAEVDLAELFTSGADTAMHDDKKCTDEAYAIPGGCASSSFYIRNNDPATRFLEMSGQAQILSRHYLPNGDYQHASADEVGMNREPKTLRLQEFENFFEAMNRTGMVSEIPYHLTLNKGVVIKLEEQLTP